MCVCVCVNINTVWTKDYSARSYRNLELRIQIKSQPQDWWFDDHLFLSETFLRTPVALQNIQSPQRAVSGVKGVSAV